MNAQGIAHAPRQLDTELFLITAPTRAELPGRIQALQAGLRKHPTLPLRDFAYSMGRTFNPQDACLSVVATTVDDLATKLERALKQLNDPTCQRVQDKSGVYFYSERLGHTGKVAWLFPGEGAQYPQMLGDLCVHMPHVRAMFDLVDLACRQEDAAFIPSAYVFPPPGTLPSQNGDDLYAWDAAVMAVVGANMAMMKLFQSLDVPAHATVGHSFGEFSSLELGGMLDGEGEQRVHLLRVALQQIREISGFKDIPDAVLVNIGGAEPTRIAEVIAQHAPDLCIAMANCPHQLILCATGPERDRVAQSAMATLAADGAICTPLPFHRPYHTAHFAPAMVVERRFYTDAGMRSPKLDVYSCCSADRFPQDEAGIIDVATQHWASPVLFQATIERMYADGVRVFLEVGPRGNLCAFVDDILRDQAHVAIPADREQRTTVSQLHRALGQLAAHGVPVNIAVLHAQRDSRAFDPDHWDVPVDDTLKRTIQMGLESPVMDAAQYVRDVGPLRRATTPAPAVAPAAAPAPAPAAASPSFPFAPPTLPVAPATAHDQVMESYLRTMNQFLAAQEQIVNYFAPGANRAAPAPVAAPPAAPATSPPRPMLGEVIALQPGVSIDVVKTFDVDHDLYLRDHTLGTRISAFDPELAALPIMPLLFSLELMGEAALALCPEARVVTAHEDMRANRWIFFDRGRLTLRTTARRMATADGSLRVHVEIREDSGAHDVPAIGPCLVETTVHLAGDYPSAHSAPRLSLQTPETAGWSGEAIYPRRTFHGPCFQGIRTVDQIGANGLNGTLTVLPRDKMFRGESNPSITFDPLLSDCLGQSIWVWGNKNPDAPHFFLPFYVGAMRFSCGPLPAGTSLSMDLELRKESDPAIVSCDVRALDSQGMVRTEISNLRDRAFEIPLSLKRMLLQPLQHAFSESWLPPPAVTQALRGRWAFARISGFPRAILESSFGVWRRAWAFVVLNPPERAQWLAMEGQTNRQIEWLWGRTCAKDAVRTLLGREAGTTLGAADIVIGTEPGGRPIVTGGWKHDLPRHPAISIAHKEGIAIAAACDAGGPPGIDIERIRTPTPGLVEGTLSTAELALLPPGATERDEWFFRAWAAKEAVGKALGTGVLPDPRAFVLERVDAASGALQLRVPGRATLETAFTFRDQDYAVAICQRLA